MARRRGPLRPGRPSSRPVVTSAKRIEAFRQIKQGILCTHRGVDGRAPALCTHRVMGFTSHQCTHPVRCSQCGGWPDLRGAPGVSVVITGDPVGWCTHGPGFDRTALMETLTTAVLNGDSDADPIYIAERLRFLGATDPAALVLDLAGSRREVQRTIDIDLTLALDTLRSWTAVVDHKDRALRDAVSALNVRAAG